MIGKPQNKPITPEQKLSQLNPCRIILGYDKEGNFSSTLIETKEEFIVAMDKYVGGKVYELVLSKELDWYKNRVEKDKKIKEANENKL